MTHNGLIKDAERMVPHQVRSPRSAAIAGIVFSGLIAASMILLYSNVRASPVDVGDEWLESWSGAATVVLVLVPFAGIAFLWFTGVIRDLVGDREDRFFATVFFGSGIILVVMMYTWAAAVGAILSTYAATAHISVDKDVYIFGLTFMDQIIGSYFLRMGAVYMLSISSLWTRARVVPRWLTIVSYVVGLSFLLFASWLRWARFMFPAWVLLVSIYILVQNYRSTHDREGQGEMPLDLST